MNTSFGVDLIGHVALSRVVSLHGFFRVEVISLRSGV